MSASSKYNRSAAGQARYKRYRESLKGQRNEEKHRGYGGVRTQRARQERIAQRKGE